MILILDNKDSFVWNLAQALMQLGAEVTVRRSDDLSLDDLAAARALVLSPGPGRPEDAGICVPAVRRWSGTVPILGVCLGHQAVAQAFGAAVERGAPCHGKQSEIHHRGTGLFRALPSPLPACRYHSLTVPTADLPPDLEVDAWTAAGEIMSLRHRSHPTYGLQFHPESFRTPDGHVLLGNFLAEVA